MTRILPLAAACFFVLTAVIRADAPPAEPPADPAVQKLIEQLGDDDFHVREEASRQLKAVGIPALPALRKALAHPNAEVRRRAGELLPALETAAVLAPKRITFKTADKPIKDAFDEVARQTGYHIEYNVNDPSRLYSFDFHDAPFWEVVDKLGRSAGLVLQANYGDDHVRLYPQDGYSPYVSYAGAFRFSATAFSQYRGIEFGLTSSGAPRPQARTDSLTLMFSVFVEPKMAILGVGGPHLDSAYDDEHHSMLPPVNADDLLNNPQLNRRWTAGRFGNGGRLYSTQTQANLQRPSAQAATAKVVRGTLPVTLLVEEKESVVTDRLAEAKGVKATVGTTQFVVEDVAEQPNKQVTVKLSVSDDTNSDPNDYSWVNSLYQRIRLLDAKGNPMQLYQNGVSAQSASRAEMQMTFGAIGGAKPEPPGKLVYETWVTRQEEVPFEFKDLPLP